MEILEAYDLTGSLRQAAALVGCDHKTVAYWVRLRDEAGGMPVGRAQRGRRWRTVFAAKIDELVDRSHGQDPGGSGAREAGRDRLSGVGADDAAVGG